MKSSQRLVFALLALLTAFSASAEKQPKTPLIVAPDGSGDFTTIQDAVYAVRDYTPVPITILVRNGVYREKLVIPSWKCDITIRGEHPDSVIITWADAAPDSTVYFGTPLPQMGTFRTHTVLVAGNDITLENLTIVNSSTAKGQCVALHTEGTRIAVVNCRLLGRQDTLFTGNPEAYLLFENCLICGTTDFIFGPATAWFQSCTIRSLSNSYITAASTSPHRSFGYVFSHCDLMAANGVDRVYLGRPWRAHAAVLFMRCNMQSHIRPEGWENWRDPANERTARYAEFECRGPGADRSARVPWCSELTPEQAARITLHNVLSPAGHSPNRPADKPWYLAGR